MNRAVLRPQRHGGHCSQTAVSPVCTEEFTKVDITEAIAVGGQESVAHVRFTAPDPIPGVAVFTRVDHLNLPVTEPFSEVVSKHFLTVAGCKNEMCQPLLGEASHQMYDDRGPADRRHGFWEYVRKWIGT